MTFTTFIIIIAALLNFTLQGSLKAQAYHDITGEYSLQGIPEMAAGFKFNDDSTFQFFYIYGASDRSAEGKYRVENDKIILTGTKAAGNDFNITQKKKSGSGFIVSITDSNKLLMKDVVCFFIRGVDTFLVQTNAEGIANAEINDCDKILIIHSFYPDLPTVINTKDDDSDFFVLTLNQSLTEVVFDNAVIEIDKENSDAIRFDNLYLFPKKMSFVKK